MEQAIADYNRYNYLGTIFSVALLFSVIEKAIFNFFAEVKLPLDRWTLIDIVTSFFNIVCFNYVGKATKDDILIQERK